MVKVAVPRNDEVCKDLVSVSLYDSKPIYFLSNACTSISWTEKTKKVMITEKNIPVAILQAECY